MRKIVFILVVLLLSLLCYGDILLDNLDTRRLFPNKQNVELLSNNLFEWQKDMKDVYSERHFNILGDFNKDGIKDLAILCKYQPRVDSTDYFLAIISYEDVNNPHVEFVKYFYYKENLANKNIADHIFKATSNFDLDKLQLDFIERIEFPEKLTGLAINPHGTLLTCFFGKRDGIDIQWIINKYTAEEWFDAPDANVMLRFVLTAPIKEDMALLYLAKYTGQNKVDIVGYNGIMENYSLNYYIDFRLSHNGLSFILYPPDLAKYWYQTFKKYSFVYLILIKVNKNVNSIIKEYISSTPIDKDPKEIYQHFGENNIVKYWTLSKNLIEREYKYVISYPKNRYYSNR